MNYFVELFTKPKIQMSVLDEFIVALLLIATVTIIATTIFYVRDKIRSGAERGRG